MPADKRSFFSTSRRALLDAASLAPVAVRAKPASSSAVVERCGRWLETDAEIDRLILHWADLDRQASAEREGVDRQLERLRCDLAYELEQIAEMRAPDLHAVIGKLAVVASATREDGGPVHAIVLDVLASLRGYGA